MKKLFLLLSWLIISNSVNAQNGIHLNVVENLAKQGDLSAQIKLANAYRKGIGVTQDYKTAVKWFTLAAERGDAVKGVPENLVYAHMWAKQASSNGFEMATELTELLTEFMTANQIEKAKRLG
mgnify:CR=1 FL=1